jgi:hypothetical protein
LAVVVGTSLKRSRDGGAFDVVRFTSATSPLRNGGVGGSPVTQDIRGAARMPPPDIGAWEWP